jgi:hypothetical protein
LRLTAISIKLVLMDGAGMARFCRLLDLKAIRRAMMRFRIPLGY